MPFVEASDGAKIFWQAQGSGPPLLLSNASFSTHLHWAGQLDALARFARVVTWDYRGHGLSDAPEQAERYTLSQVVDDLRCVHDAAAGGEPAFVGGLSVGGIVSLSYARAHRERVKALLLLNTGPGFKNPEALAQWESMLERAAAKMGEVGLEKYLEGSRAQAELLGLHPETEQAAEARRGILRVEPEIGRGRRAGRRRSSPAGDGMGRLASACRRGPLPHCARGPEQCAEARRGDYGDRATSRRRRRCGFRSGGQRQRVRSQLCQEKRRDGPAQHETTDRDAGPS